MKKNINMLTRGNLRECGINDTLSMAFLTGKPYLSHQDLVDRLPVELIRQLAPLDAWDISAGVTRDRAPAKGMCEITGCGARVSARFQRKGSPRPGTRLCNRCRLHLHRLQITLDAVPLADVTSGVSDTPVVPASEGAAPAGVAGDPYWGATSPTPESIRQALADLVVAAHMLQLHENILGAARARVFEEQYEKISEALVGLGRVPHAQEVVGGIFISREVKDDLLWAIAAQQARVYPERVNEILGRFLLTLTGRD